MVLKRTTWPHEVEYTSTGKPTAYEDMSVASCVLGYITIMSAEDNSIRGKMLQHLEELMGDVGLYGWEHVHAYHVIGLNQMDNGRYTLDDTEAKL